MSTRLSTLDASFLEVESPSAHMHVGWASLFRPPPGGGRPSFEEVRDHIAGRMCRAPRYRQRLARVPFDLSDPVWVDDEEFDIDRHVHHSDAVDIGEAADEVMSALSALHEAGGIRDVFHKVPLEMKRKWRRAAKSRTRRSSSKPSDTKSTG